MDWLVANWDKIATVVALVLAIVAIILHYRDRPRLSIGTITVQFDEKFVYSLTVRLHNDGSRPAIGATGVVSLQRDPALVLYRGKRGGHADTSADRFDVPPESVITLVAAWNFLPDGGVDPTWRGKPTHRFRDENFPINVEVTLGKKNIGRVMKQADFIRIHQAYLNSLARPAAHD